MRADKRLSFLLTTLAPERPTRIADVGARAINDNPYAPLLAANAAKVWGFEPDAEAFSELQSIKSENEEYFPHAVGDGGPATLNICKGGGFSSLLKPNQRTLDFIGRWSALMRVVKEIPLETKRLDDIEGLPRVDLLKIDVQGGELAVFEGGRDRLSEAVAVITETAFTPLYEDQPLLDAQMQALRGQGFQLHKFLHVKSYVLRTPRSDRLAPRQHKNQMIDGDAVFIRDLRHPKNFSDEQLKHLAILADCVFHSYDVVLKALDHLVARGVILPRKANRYAAAVPHQREPAPV